MLAEERNRRQKNLEEYIRNISKSLLDESGTREIALKLLDIYQGDFRHNYSGFFPIILEISKSDNEYNLDCLSENIENIRAYIENDFVSGEKEFKDLYDQLNKLCDHLNLEIGRWSYYSQNEQKISDIESKTVRLTSTMQSAERELRRSSKQAASIQTELIAVLSIFAAIVTTFSGGFTFLGSVMSSIENAKHYEVVVLTAIICGMVIFNTIFLMMYLVSKITDRNIYARCLTSDCSCDKKECKCTGIRRIRKRLPYVFYFNIFCISGILIDCVVWLLDIRGII